MSVPSFLRRALRPWPALAGRGLRTLALALLAVTLSSLLALGHQVWRGDADAAARPATVIGWGAEALVDDAVRASALSVIGIANACGLGASSCVRCHDGQRAPAPVSNAEVGAWHRDHARVAYSCVGCHQGNPRVLRQDVAHHKLVADPRTAPATSCASCHGTAEAASFAARYPHSNPPSP